MKLEVCIDSLESLLNAYSMGANRVEITSSLNLDGLTPHPSLVYYAQEIKDIEKFVMIRPRSGNFCYNDFEFSQMTKDIEIYKNFEIDGFVLGILDKYDNLDLKRLKELIEISKPKKVVFHRAFDIIKNHINQSKN